MFITAITTKIRYVALFVGAVFLFAPVFAHAQEQAFPDVPPDHFAYDAIQFLQKNGIVSGNPDGTFKPDAKVSRAAAAKLVVAPLITNEQLEQAQNAKSSYTDVPEDVWYKPYVELARVAGIIDGPPKKTAFLGASNVIKVEFFKMLQLANNVDPNSYSEIRLPLSQDVSNVDEWYYPYMRYGIASSLTMISTEGTLNPAKDLTRAETALLLYRFLMYTSGLRTQALLSEAENEILIILSSLEDNDITEAEYASARALLAARGALTSRPNESIVQAAVKITESALRHS